MKRIFLIALGLLALSVGCTLGGLLPGQPTQPAATPTASRPVAASPLPVQGIATATAAARPTRSLTPSPIPIPSRTPVTPSATSLPTPQGRAILIEYFDKYGGEEPILLSDAYAGTNMPRLVIYTDGQVIWRDDAGALFETSMTDDTMCVLLTGIRTLGFFKAQGDGTLLEDDPIYGDIPQKYLDITDSTSFLIDINGTPSKWVTIYRPYVDTLVRPVKSTWDLFNSFVPEDLQPYEPALYAVWIEAEQKLARKYGAGVDLEPVEWPKGMIPLSRLLGDEESVQVPMDPEEADPLLPYFDPAPGAKIFTQGRDRYSVLLRPLLPHEEMDLLSIVPQQATAFGLPFNCTK